MSPESAPRFRVLLTDEVLPEGLQILRGCAALEVDLRAGIGATELKSIIGDYDALIVRGRTKVTADLLEAADRLKVLGRAGVGVDNIDVTAASCRGVVVLNATGGNVVSVAEHTLALILALVRHIARADASLKRGAWERSRFRGNALSGKTLGILGAGRIGSEVARRARAFAMRVVAYDPYLAPERAEQLEIELVTLASLLREADVVSVHAPLTEETRGLIGARELALMKPTAYLVNAARGGIVDEKALAEALRAGALAGAALDVFEKEPVPADHPLLKLENVLAVPHLGAATHEAQTSIAIEICEAVRDALVSGEFRGAVNLAEIQAKQTPNLQR